MTEVFKKKVEKSPIYFAEYPFIVSGRWSLEPHSPPTSSSLPTTPGGKEIYIFNIQFPLSKNPLLLSLLFLSMSLMFTLNLQLTKIYVYLCLKSVSESLMQMPDLISSNLIL